MPDDREDRLLSYVEALVPRRRKVVLTVDSPLFEDRLLHSMNILDLIGYLERERGRRLTPRDLVMTNFRDVRTIAQNFLDEPARK